MPKNTKTPQKKNFRANIKGLPSGNPHYELEVVFSRDLAEDIEILESNPENDGLEFPEAVARQLARELQEAFNKCGISGSFEVKVASLRTGWVQYERLLEKRAFPRQY